MMMRIPPSSAESFLDVHARAKSNLDAICGRIKDGQKVCSEVVYYFKQRAKAEYDYSRALLGCSKNTDPENEARFSCGWWQELNKQTLEVASVHDQAGGQYNFMAKELQLISEDHAKKAQTAEENVKRGLIYEKANYQKAIVYRNYFEQKRKTYDLAQESYSLNKRFVTVATKDIRKSRLKAARMKKEQDDAGQAYNQAVEQFVEICKRWEPEMEQALKELEEIETTASKLLKEKLLQGTSIDALTASRQDECSEKLKTSLENCDVLLDGMKTIQKKRTLSQNSGLKQRHPRTLQRNMFKHSPFLIDEFGYATAYSDASSVHSSTTENSELPSLEIGDPLAKQHSVESQISVDCGYFSMVEIQRSPSTDKENSPEVVPVMQIISGNGEASSVIPTDEKNPAKETLEVPSANPYSTVEDTQGLKKTVKKPKASGGDVNNGTTSKAPGTESKALTQLEQKQPTQGSDQTGYTRLQEWQDDFGYASVKEIRRRKRMASQKLFVVNKSKETKPSRVSRSKHLKNGTSNTF